MALKQCGILTLEQCVLCEFDVEAMQQHDVGTMCKYDVETIWKPDVGPMKKYFVETM